MFLALKIVGAAYLLWLAVDAVRNGSSLNVRVDRPQRVALWPTLALGLTVNLTNPKVVLFYLTFLPQFVDAHDPHATGKLLFLGIYFVVLAYPLGVLLILGAERVVGGLKARPRCCAPSTGCSRACSARSRCAFSSRRHDDSAAIARYLSAMHTPAQAAAPPGPRLPSGGSDAGGCHGPGLAGDAPSAAPPG